MTSKNIRTAEGIRLGSALRKIQARNAGAPVETPEELRARLIAKVTLRAQRKVS